MTRGQAAQITGVRQSSPDEAALDLVDVPAAVVCAHCGEPDCAGCDERAEATQASGVVAIIPWENLRHGLLARWWSTAQLSTLNHRSFFGALPDGDWQPALKFAVLSELFAVSGLVLAGLALAAPLVPGLPRLLVEDPVVRRVVLEAVLWGIPLLSAIMVGLHALYGVVTDLAAAREGSRRRGRGLRFGLYGCGWDVITLPLGLILLGLTQGVAPFARALPLGLTAPGQSVRGYLSGVHGLPPDKVRRAAARAARMTGVALLGLVLVAALAALSIAYLAH